jgi:hypothetical protein
MSLESSVSLWDALSFWLVTAGVVLAFLGGLASIKFLRYNVRLVAFTAERNRQDKLAGDKAIAEANARAKEAEARAADANEKAERERLARMQLEAAISPIRLNEKDIGEIADPCRPFGKSHLKCKSRQCR